MRFKKNGAGMKLVTFYPSKISMFPIVKKYGLIYQFRNAKTLPIQFKQSGIQTLKESKAKTKPENSNPHLCPFQISKRIQAEL